MNKTALRKIFFGLTTATIILSTSALSAFAASSISLSPATGNIDADGTTLTVNFNSDSAQVAGASFKIAYTGSVSYVSSASTACNQSFDVQQGTNALVVSCLFTDTKTFNGNLGTFVFKSTADSGSSTFTISNPDPADATVTGGTYTIVGTSNGDTDLPSTGIFDLPVYITAGFILILFGGVLFGFTKRGEKVAMLKAEQEYEEFINSPKMKDKLTGK